MKRELEDVERFLKYHRESLQQVCYSQMLIYCLYLFAKGQWYWYVIDFWHSLFLLECRLKQRTPTHKRAQENQNHQSHQLLMHHKKETSDTYLKASELTSLDLAYYLPPCTIVWIVFLGGTTEMIIYSRWLMSISLETFKVHFLLSWMHWLIRQLKISHCSELILWRSCYAPHPPHKITDSNLPSLLYDVWLLSSLDKPSKRSWNAFVFLDKSNFLHVENLVPVLNPIT